LQRLPRSRRSGPALRPAGPRTRDRGDAHLGLPARPRGQHLGDHRPPSGGGLLPGEGVRGAITPSGGVPAGAPSGPSASPAFLLQGRHVRLEPLTLDHEQPLLRVALEPELWLWTTAKVDTPEDFHRYFTTAL